MTKDELAQDLAYVRTLAEEGRHAPLIGGGFLVFFGALLSICYFLQWAFLTQLFGRMPADAFTWLWVGYGVMATLGGVFGGRRARRMPGASSVVNRVDRAVWQSVGLAIMVVVLGCISRMIALQDWTAPNAIMASAFAMFGVALSVTATIGQIGWLRPFAWLAFIASVQLWVFMNEPWAYLLSSIASALVLVLPGVLMMRREPSPVV